MGSGFYSVEVDKNMNLVLLHLWFLHFGLFLYVKINSGTYLCFGVEEVLLSAKYTEVLSENAY